MVRSEELIIKIQNLLKHAPNKEQRDMCYLMILMLMETLNPDKESPVEIYHGRKDKYLGPDIFTIIVPSGYGRNK